MQKRSRKLSRKEKVTLVILLVAIAVGIGAWQWFLQQRAADREAFEEAQKQQFAMGDAVVLDSAQDESAVDTESAFDTEGVPYMAGFPWRGRMEVTVQSAKLYDTAAAAGIDEKKLFMGNTPGLPFLLIEVTIKNIDAEQMSSQSGKNWSNISFIRVPGLLDLSYFDGTPPGANPSEWYCFALDKGSEATYHLGGFVDPTDADHPFDTLTLGGSSDKYTVKLDIQDMRGGEAT